MDILLSFIEMSARQRVIRIYRATSHSPYGVMVIRRTKDNLHRAAADFLLRQRVSFQP